MKIKPILISFSLLFLASCTATKSSTGSYGSGRVETNESAPKPRPTILRPVSQKSEPRLSKAVQITEPSKKFQPERIKMVFNERECANVRVPGINILPLGGIDIDLNAQGSDFCYPYRGKMISDYGLRGRSTHTGVDIKALPGDTIRAAFAGVVRMSKIYSGYGNLIVIRHYNGIETVYSHSARNLVKVNDIVEAGQPIALAGRTGRATTEHLHFEVRIECEPIDPKKLIDTDNMRLRSGVLHIRQQSGRVIAYNTEQEGESLRAEIATAAANKQPVVGAAPVATAAKPAASSPQMHTVKSGETMSQIARRYSTTVSKICSLNKISNPDKLRLGQKLRVK